MEGNLDKTFPQSVANQSLASELIQPLIQVEEERHVRREVEQKKAINSNFSPVEKEVNEREPCGVGFIFTKEELEKKATIKYDENME